MKKIFITIITCLLLISAYGQRNEIRVTFNSGLFSFSGISAESVSFINFNKVTNKAYTNNPYGTKNGLCFGFSGNFMKVTGKNFIYGTDLGFEILRSKILIDEINGNDGGSTYKESAIGQTFLNYDFLNIFPFLGYRILINEVNCDVTGGFDYGHCVSAIEKGEASTSTGQEYKTSVDRKTLNNDLRIRFQIALNYKKFGTFAGYSFGLKNYKSGYIGGTNECYSRMIRFGITYQFK